MSSWWRPTLPAAELRMMAACSLRAVPSPTFPVLLGEQRLACLVFSHLVKPLIHTVFELCSRASSGNFATIPPKRMLFMIDLSLFLKSLRMSFLIRTEAQGVPRST